MESSILLAVYILLPALAIFLCSKFQFLNRLGTVVLCYVFGLILGPLGASSDEFYQLQEILMSVCVPLAIPLLLFSSNVTAWRQLAIKPLYSLLFAMLAVFTAVVGGYFLFHGNEISDFNKIGGMLVGIYSGGTPNLASLKLMLDVKEEVYLAVHSYDMAIGAIYLFVLMSFGQRLFQFVLPSYKAVACDVSDDSNEPSLRTLFTSAEKRMKLFIVFGIALIMVAISGSIMLLVPDASAQMVVFIFLITAFGIAGSSVRQIRNTEGTFNSGMYLILIFSIVVASKVQLGSFTNINPSIFGYITFVVFVSLALHVLLARFKKIDADTVIVTSAALICSPPFVPVVAGSLKNRSLIVPGLTVGLIGYAAGNYLGYAMSVLLGLF